MIRSILLTTMLVLGCGVDSGVRATAIRAGLSETAGTRCFNCKSSCWSARQKLIDLHGVSPDEVSCETPRIVGADRSVEACRGALWDELGVTLR
ncbi:MAG: hypothetical protein MUC96_31020 [Myxococcaceae bacterium]|jgi:hypothetical protein|nr:hypothetical protein [Myxococcaceae bacterium]